MTSQRDVLRQWKKLLGSKQDAPVIRFALTGDGSDSATAEVANRPGWAWVRYDEEPHKVSQVRNRIFPGIVPEVPVVIGKRYESDRMVQILGINEALYDMAMSEGERISYLVAPHGPTHHALLGTDPAEIDVANILNGKCRATDPESMSVEVEAVAYFHNGKRETFGGGGVDFTGDDPGATNYQRYGLVTFDVREQALRKTLGLSSPNTVPATPPDVPLWNIPIAVVLLYYGMTAVTVDYIYDYRILFPPTGIYQIYRNFNQFMHYNELMWTRHLTGEL